MMYNMTYTYNKFTRQEGENIYLMNDEGSAFIIGTDIQKDVNPFEAYAIRNTASNALNSAPRFFGMEAPRVSTEIMEIIRNKDNAVNGLTIVRTYNGVMIYSEIAKKVDIYSIDGRQVKSVFVEEGENFVELSKGIYIIDRQKIVI